jgi:hypothetical protein
VEEKRRYNLKFEYKWCFLEGFKKVCCFAGWNASIIFEIQGLLGPVHNTQTSVGYFVDLQLFEKIRSWGLNRKFQTAGTFGRGNLGCRRFMFWGLLGFDLFGIFKQHSENNKHHFYQTCLRLLFIIFPANTYNEIVQQAHKENTIHHAFNIRHKLFASFFFPFSN